MLTPQFILNSDLSGDAKHLWNPCAHWGVVNGKLFATNLDEFLRVMEVEAGFKRAKTLKLMEKIIRSGLHPEVYGRAIVFRELADSVSARTVRLLKVIGCLNEERQPA